MPRSPRRSSSAPLSAELRHDQRDEDSLPPYELLDRILHGYIELDRSREQLIADGLPEREVDRTIRLVDLAEYKRRQAPPGIKVTTRAFGRDRRMPITNRYTRPVMRTPPRRSPRSRCTGSARSRSAACGNTLQDQPIPHNKLESLVLAPYPVYWLGGSFHGLAITEAARDPSGAFTVQYGDCLEGGQSTCVTAAEDGHLSGQQLRARRRLHDPRTTASLRGVGGFVAERGKAIAIPTGGVVLDIYAHTPALARAAAATAVPINHPGVSRSLRCPRRCPTPASAPGRCPRQVPNPLKSLRLARRRAMSAPRATGARRSSSASPRTCGRRRR